MFITTNKKIGFIHIPKCGGSSISAAFRHGEKGPNKSNPNDPWSPWYPVNAHSTYRRAVKNKVAQPETWFTTVRNPYSRFHSWYYYQIAWHKKRINGELKMKAFTVEEMQRQVDLLEQTGIKDTLLNLDEILAQGVPNQIGQPQYVWIDGCENIRWFKLEEIEKLYEWLHEMGCDVEYSHVKKNPKKLTWQEEFDDEMIEYVQKRYAIDFEKFGYDR